MYCKMCGTLLGDADLFCRMCGYEIEERKKPSQNKEKIVHTPSFESMDQEQDIEENTEMKKDLNEDSSGEEFSWNIYEFPKPKKTEEIDFDWNVGDNYRKRPNSPAFKGFLDDSDEKTTFVERKNSNPREESFFSSTMTQESSRRETRNTKKEPLVLDWTADTLQQGETTKQNPLEFQPEMASKEGRQETASTQTLKEGSERSQFAELPTKQWEETQPQNADTIEALSEAQETGSWKSRAFTERSTFEPEEEIPFNGNHQEGENGNLSRDTIDLTKTIRYKKNKFMEHVLTGFKKDTESDAPLNNKGTEPIQETEQDTYSNTDIVTDKVVETELFTDLTGVKPDERDKDNFFVFNKKNEEFQKLLDKEFDRVRTTEIADSRNMEPTSSLNEVIGFEEDSDCGGQAASIQSDIHDLADLSQPISMDMEGQGRPLSNQTETEIGEQEPQEEADNKKTPLMFVSKEGSSNESAEGETPIIKTNIDRGYLDEMSAARESFFAEQGFIKSEGEQEEEAVDQNKKKYDTVEIMVNASNPLKVEVALSKDQKKQKGQEQAEELTEKQPETGDAGEKSEFPPYIFPFESDETDRKQKKKKRTIRIIAGILAVILLLGLGVWGIKYLAPNSALGKVFNERGALTTFFEKKLGKGKPKGNDATVTDGGVQNNQASIYPQKDKNVLIANQMSRNQNILKIRANDSLAYVPGRDYGNTDINNSVPIQNNIWTVGENGEPVYFDNEIVGTIIAYDSQWIDYINNGNEAVLNLLLPDSAAYQNAVAFSQKGKIQETFNLLEIGEIRKGETDYYTWCHEEIQKVDGSGKTSTESRNWIYALEPVGDQFKIVNFYKF